MQEVMQATDIAFPHLGVYLTNVPKSFDIFGITIAFYGVIIGLGVLAGLALWNHDAKVTGQNPDNYFDFAIYAIIFSIIGARIYYVAFSFDMYKDDLLSIFNTRKGGLAIYGAVIAAFLTLFVFTKVKNLSFFQMADTGVLGLVLGQVIGRWGNFMNREAFGTYSDGLLAMRLPLEAVRANEITEDIASQIIAGSNYIQVHPTFLYESMFNLCLLLLLLWYRRRKKFQGEVTLLYLAGYGIGRFFIEGLRTDQLQIGSTGIAVSQVLGMVLFVSMMAVWVVWRIKVKKEGTALENPFPNSRKKKIREYKN